jgi:hypothetical protein
MLFIRKLFLYLLLLNSLGSLCSCTYFSIRSKEAIDAEEEKPWNKNKGTVEELLNSKSQKHLTPHIGVKIPVEASSNLVKAPKSQEPVKIRTCIDKKRQEIKIIKEEDKELKVLDCKEQ